LKRHLNKKGTSHTYNFFDQFRIGIYPSHEARLSKFKPIHTSKYTVQLSIQINGETL